MTESQKNQKNKFHIDDPKQFECPTCKSVYRIENDMETILRKITFLHIDKKTRETTVKCRECKSMIEFIS